MRVRPLLHVHLLRRKGHLVLDDILRRTLEDQAFPKCHHGQDDEYEPSPAHEHGHDEVERVKAL